MTEKFDHLTDREILIIAVTDIANITKHCDIMDQKLTALNHVDKDLSPRLSALESKVSMICRITMYLLATTATGGGVAGILAGTGVL